MEIKIKVLRDIDEDQREIQKLNRMMITLLIALIALIPLITRGSMNLFVSPIIGHALLETGLQGDIFTYYKWWLLLATSMILLLLFLYKTTVLGSDISVNYMNLLLGLFFISLLISLVFAPYKSIALYGLYNRNEGTFTYLLYLMIFFIASSLTYSTKQISYFFYALIPLVVVNVVLGVTGFYNFDLLQYDWIKKILFPSELLDSIQESSKFITTINHGNYVSGISGVLISMFLTLSMLTSNKVKRLVFMTLTILSFTLLFSSLARSGFVALVFTIPVILFLVLRSQIKIKAFVTAAIILVITTAIFIPMGKHNAEVWDRTFGFFVKGNPFLQEELSLSNEGIRDISTSATKVLGVMSPLQKVFAESQVQEEFQLPSLPERGVGAGSGRVYIWGHTLDLVKERPLVGYGMDTLPLFFPQNDPEMYANIEDYNLIVDKPHNMYLGILYGAGIIAFISFLGMLLIHFANNAKLFIRTKISDEKTIYLAALFAGWWAYLVQGVFNDTIIGTAPIFFVLFGVAVALYNNLKDKIIT